MKNKNKLKYLTLGILLTGAVGFSTLAVKQVQVKAENENVVNINRENKKLVSYDDEGYTITLSANELNNYSFENFANALIENQLNISNIFLRIEYNDNSGNSVEYAFENYSDNELDLANVDNDLDNPTVFESYIYFYSENESNYSFSTYTIVDNVQTQNHFINDATLYINNAYYSALKSAIELDIQANESSYGESIITAISSGLGLIPDLAQEFLNGFTTLFWNSAQEKLTDFGTFALVFLGVAITMAVVKLCLAILRSNTGA